MRVAIRVFVVSLAVSLSFLSTAAFAQEADLAVIKTGPDTAAAGTDVSYDVFLINGGPDDASSALLTDNVPAGMTFTSLVQNSGPTFSCSMPGVGLTGTISCSLATFVNGDTADFTVTLHIPPATPPSTFFTNTAMIASQTFDPNSENDVSSASTSTPANDGDLAIGKNGPSSAAPNSDVTYAITLANAGPSAATTVSIFDTLPGTMTFVSLTQNNGPAFSCTNPGGGNGGTINCTIASMANGASASFTLVGHIPNGTPGGTTFQNNVTVTSANDPTPDNNAATTLLTVSSVDLAMTKTGPPTVIAGNNLSYSITIMNNGPDTALNAQFADTLPAQAQFLGFTQNTGPAASCGNTGVPSGGTAACVLATLNSGQSANFTLDVFVPTSVPDGAVLTNTVTASSQSFDTNGANDTASANTTVIGVTDLAVTKNGPTGVAAGNKITYTITVTNSGASPAATSQLTDNVPAQTTFVSFIQTGGPVAGCATPSLGGTGTVTCNWASIAPGASATFTFIVQTSGAASGNIVNTANVTTATTDTNPANNTSSSTTAIALPADLAVTKTASPGPYGTGQLITWTITVNNNGGVAAAANVTVTDVLPAGSTFASAVPSTGSCSGTTTVTCNLGTLNVGASATITLKANLPPTSGVVSNTATATTTTPDSNPANDSATSTVTTIPAAQLPAISPAMLLLLAAMLAGIALMARR
jgi:uncharacterized repeat protein (TIGR01451 family)